MVSSTHLFYCGLFRSYFSFVLGFVASCHLLPVIYIVCIKHYANYASRVSTLCINLCLPYSVVCSSVGADRMNVWDYGDTVILGYGV
jgi:hypothetical protein